MMARVECPVLSGPRSPDPVACPRPLLFKGEERKIRIPVSVKTSATEIDVRLGAAPLLHVRGIGGRSEPFPWRGMGAASWRKRAGRGMGAASWRKRAGLPRSLAADATMLRFLVLVKCLYELRSPVSMDGTPKRDQQPRNFCQETWLELLITPSVSKQPNLAERTLVV